jgi:O-antigen/teichoic acid export membrane protein
MGVNVTTSQKGSLFKKILRVAWSPDVSRRERFFSGMFWLNIFALAKKPFGLIQTIILARLLSPESFGVMSIALMSIGFLNTFSQTGFNKAIIHSPKIDDGMLNTAWTVAILRGILLSIILFMCAPMIASFFKADYAAPMIAALGLKILFFGFQNIGLILLSKELRFNRRIALDAISFLVNITVTITLAFLLRNAWAIIYGIIVEQIFTTLFSYRVSSYRPRLKFSLNSFYTLFQYGRWVTINKVVLYVSSQMDKVVLGKLLGVSLLGIYTIALQLAEYTTKFTDNIRTILFPALSSINSEPEKVKNAFLNFMSVVVFFVYPIQVCIIVLGDSFIHLFLGDEWGPAFRPMQILCVGALGRIFFTSCFPLFNAVGKPNYVFFLNFLRVAILISIIFPLSFIYKINGIAMAYTVSYIICIPIAFRMILRQLSLSLPDFYFLLYPTIGSLLLGICFYSFKEIGLEMSYCSFFISLTIGAVGYGGIALMLNRFSRVRLLYDYGSTLSTLWR